MPDGTYNDYEADALIENIMAEVDDNSQTTLVLDHIIGHRFNNDSLKKAEGWYSTPQGDRNEE